MGRPPRNGPGINKSQCEIYASRKGSISNIVINITIVNCAAVQPEGYRLGGSCSEERLLAKGVQRKGGCPQDTCIFFELRVVKVEAAQVLLEQSILRQMHGRDR